MSDRRTTHAIWPLAKVTIVERTETYIKLDIGGSTTITIHADMRHYDVRTGDMLTLYTEVPFVQPHGSA